MATKKVAAFTAGLPDEPDYEDLLNKRQKVTPIKGDPLTVNATRQAQYFDTVATGQGLGDKRSDVAENLSQLGTNSAVNRDMSSSQFNDALATRRATDDQFGLGRLGRRVHERPVQLCERRTALHRQSSGVLLGVRQRRIRRRRGGEG